MKCPDCNAKAGVVEFGTWECVDCDQSFGAEHIDYVLRSKLKKEVKWNTTS